jgi:hypothetical protein
MPAGLVISFRERRKETEAYVNNGAIIRKGLYIIDHRIRGKRAQNQERDNAGRAEKKKIRRTWRNVSSLVFQLRLLT